MSDCGNCECGAPLASGGAAGLYCTNKECPMEKALVRHVSKSLAQHRGETQSSDGQCGACESAFRALASHGVPRERARSVRNGIQVLVTRMLRESIAQSDEIQRLRGALTDVSLWLRSALNFKHWVWDSGQREAAVGSLATADDLLKVCNKPNMNTQPGGLSANGPESSDETAARMIRLANERGDFIQDVDGYVVYWPTSASGGALPAWMMRVLADEIDRRNAAWDAIIQGDPQIGPGCVQIWK